jgi:hypothetical protein
MKFLRSALIVLALLAGLLRGQDDERRAPPTEIPDFSNLDEYIYEPKSTLSYGFRGLKGAKLKFSGQGKLLSPEDAGSALRSQFAPQVPRRHGEPRRARGAALRRQWQSAH